MATYEYVLRCMQVVGNPRRPPGSDVVQCLPIIESENKIVGTCLVNEDGAGVFEDDGDTQREVPDTAAAIFRKSMYSFCLLRPK